MRIALLLALGACTPCELELLVDDPDAGPGEIRQALVLDRDSEVTSTSSGIACLACDTIFHLDHTLAERRRSSVALEGSGVVAVAGDVMDSFVARVEPSGVLGARLLGGDGFQTFNGLSAAGDGTAIAAVLSSPDQGSAILRVGSRSFDDGTHTRLYVIALMP